MTWCRRVLLLVGISLLFFAYVSAQRSLVRVARPAPTEEMYVALPGWVQVLLAGGDQYLAANLGYFRALVSSTGPLSAGTYRVLSQIQSDVATLNPSHEDNYYISAAVLSWNGEVDAAQYILGRATSARLQDVYPPFFYGFNQWYFRKDVLGAVSALRVAAAHAQDQDTRLSLLVMAANFSQRQDDPQLARGILLSMAAQTRHPQFKAYLQQRAERLAQLIVLRRAAARYADINGKPPSRLGQLVGAGLLDALPRDPLGWGYVLDGAGVPQLKRP